MASSNLCEVVAICEVLSFTDKSIAFERLLGPVQNPPFSKVTSKNRHFGFILLYK